MEIGGTLQGKYVIERCLGVGGMGSVYLARQAVLGDRRVAIKHMRAEVDAPDDRARIIQLFRAEAGLLAGLTHPSLVNVFDYFEEDDDHYFVMTYVDGCTLEQLYLDPAAVVRLDDVLAWTLQICDVLAYLHHCKPPVIYRDLKPSNVMLDRQGKIWLLDFGIAKFFDKDNQTATLLKGAGTARYASIEQVGMTSTDERADVYALGATLYTLLTRTLPPPAAALVTDPSQIRPRRINPHVPPPLEAVVCAMTAVHKEDRYSTIADVTAALRSVLPSVEALPPDERLVPLPSVTAPAVDGTTTQVHPPSQATAISVKGRGYLVDLATVLPSAETKAEVVPPAPPPAVPEAPPSAPRAIPAKRGRPRRRQAPRRWLLALVIVAVVALAAFVSVRAFGESAPLVLKWSDRPLSLRSRSGRIQPYDGMTVAADTVIATPRSQRNLFARESSQLRLSSDSELTWQGLQNLPDGERRLLLRLSRGRLWLLVGSGERWAVQAGDVLVRPLEGIVQVDHVSASCTVTVWQGRAEAAPDDHPGKLISITERQQATWTPDDALVAPHAIAMKKGDAWISWCLSDTLK